MTTYLDLVAQKAETIKKGGDKEQNRTKTDASTEHAR